MENKTVKSGRLPCVLPRVGRRGLGRRGVLVEPPGPRAALPERARLPHRLAIQGVERCHSVGFDWPKVCRTRTIKLQKIRGVVCVCGVCV